MDQQGSTAKQNPMGHVGEPRAGMSHRARCTGLKGSLLTHRAWAGSICVVQVSPKHCPCKAKGEMGSPSMQKQGEHPCFWGAGRQGAQWRKEEEKKQDCIPGEKVPGKTSSIPGDQVGKCYPGRSVSFGKEPGAQEPVPKEAAWKTLQLFYSKPPFGGHGAGAAGGERAPAA